MSIIENIKSDINTYEIDFRKMYNEDNYAFEKNYKNNNKFVSSLFEYVNKKENNDFLLDLIDKNAIYFEIIPKELKNNKVFMLNAIKKNIGVITKNYSSIGEDVKDLNFFSNMLKIFSDATSSYEFRDMYEKNKLFRDDLIKAINGINISNIKKEENDFLLDLIDKTVLYFEIIPKELKNNKVFMLNAVKKNIGVITKNYSSIGEDVKDLNFFSNMLKIFSDATSSYEFRNMYEKNKLFRNDLMKAINGINVSNIKKEENDFLLDLIDKTILYFEIIPNELKNNKVFIFNILKNDKRVITKNYSSIGEDVKDVEFFSIIFKKDPIVFKDMYEKNKLFKEDLIKELNEIKEEDLLIKENVLFIQKLITLFKSWGIFINDFPKIKELNDKILEANKKQQESNTELKKDINYFSELYSPNRYKIIQENIKKDMHIKYNGIYRYIEEKNRQNHIDSDNYIFSNIIDSYIESKDESYINWYEEQIEKILKNNFESDDFKKEFVLKCIKNNRINCFSYLPMNLKKDIDILEALLLNKEVDLLDKFKSEKMNNEDYDSILKKANKEAIREIFNFLIDKEDNGKKNVYMDGVYDRNVLFYALNNNKKLFHFLTKKNGFEGKDDDGEICDLKEDKNFLRYLSFGSVCDLLDKLYTNEIFQKDKEFWSEIVKINKEEINNKAIYDLLSEDVDYLLRLVRDVPELYYSNIYDRKNWLHQNKELVALKDCNINKDLVIPKSEKEKIKMAIKKFLCVYNYMCEELKEDKGFLVELINVNVNVYDLIENEKILKDINIIKAAIGKNPLKYGKELENIQCNEKEKWDISLLYLKSMKNMPIGYSDDSKIVLEAVKSNDERALKYVGVDIGLYINKELLKDKMFVLAAIKENINIYNSEYFDDNFRNDKDVILEGLNEDVNVYNLIKSDSYLKKDNQIIKKMLEKDPKSIMYLTSELQSLDVCKIVFEEEYNKLKENSFNLIESTFPFLSKKDTSDQINTSTKAMFLKK